jgi:hypothetical protein
MFDRKAWTRKWRDKNRTHLREYFHDYSVKNPEKILLLSAKNRAKKKGAVFNITEEDIVIPATCPVFNEPFEKIFKPTGKRGASDYAPSLDRIDNTKGYEKGNIQVISSKANSMKNSATPEQLLQFAYWVLLKYGHLIDKEIS